MAETRRGSIQRNTYHVRAETNSAVHCPQWSLTGQPIGTTARFTTALIVLTLGPRQRPV
jgi:hypothetical protein